LHDDHYRDERKTGSQQGDLVQRQIGAQPLDDRIADSQAAERPDQAENALRVRAECSKRIGLVTMLSGY
jgi:hypothetical protein